MPELPEALKQALRRDRLAQAYLFFGRPPTRMEETVPRLFQWVVCERDEGEEPCGACRACEQVTRRIHPDLVVLPPHEEDEQASVRIGVDDVRDQLLEAASLTPSHSPYKLFWLRDVRRLTPEASNTLLKVLEEPSGQALFVLTARSRWDCLPTVRSRCQWIRFAPAVRRSENPVQRTRTLLEDAAVDSDRAERWESLLEGERRSREMGWDTRQARDFLVYLLVLIHRQSTRGNSGLSAAADRRLSARLIPDVLSRLDELDRGGQPVLVVNSMLESIFYPREFSPWAPAT